jgi:hypothetical protein
MINSTIVRQIVAEAKTGNRTLGGVVYKFRHVADRAYVERCLEIGFRLNSAQIDRTFGKLV